MTQSMSRSGTQMPRNICPSQGQSDHAIGTALGDCDSIYSAPARSAHTMKANRSAQHMRHLRLTNTWGCAMVPFKGVA